MNKLIYGLLLFITLSCAYAETTTAKPFVLQTEAFLDHSTLPVLYTCDGNNVSPEFNWENAPANTQSFALILSDPDAPGGVFYHWVLYNLPKSVTTLVQGTTSLPAGANHGKNSWNKDTYNGPCPPKGSTHTYVFTLYALDTNKLTPATADAAGLLNAMQNHILSTSTLTAVYSRWP